MATRTENTSSTETQNGKNKVQRRDAAGHIDPQYAKELLAKSGKSTNEPNDGAFLGASRAAEELSEELGESYVESATSGEEASARRQDRVDESERGGPFLVTSESQEFAVGVDESNPENATREPFPKT